MERILFLREKRQEVSGVERTLIKQQTFYVRDSSKDYHTKYGIGQKEDLQKPDGTTIRDSNKHEFIIYTPTFSDKLSRLRKLPQSMIHKDAGRILAELGLGKESVAVDAGAGNGFMTALLARMCKHVFSYDTEKKHLENAKENLGSLGIHNTTLKLGSVYEPIEEVNIDAFVLDVPEPWEALQTAYDSLKIGGQIATYSPSIIQVKKTVEKASKNNGLLFVKTIELIERPWKIQNEAVRPANIEIGHTAFLTFLRKIA